MMKQRVNRGSRNPHLILDLCKRCHDGELTEGQLLNILVNDIRYSEGRYDEYGDWSYLEDLPEGRWHIDFDDVQAALNLGLITDDFFDNKFVPAIAAKWEAEG